MHAWESNPTTTTIRTKRIHAGRWCLKTPFFPWLYIPQQLSTFPTDAARQLHIFGHDCDTLGVDGAQVGICKKKRAKTCNAVLNYYTGIPHPSTMHASRTEIQGHPRAYPHTPGNPNQTQCMQAERKYRGIRAHTHTPVMDLTGGVGVPPYPPPPPPCCDEASRYASQKNPVTD